MNYICRERERERETSGDGLLVLADLCDGGGDFPVERTEDVEESDYYENGQYYAECNPSSGRRHCFSLCATERRERERSSTSFC